MPGARCVGPVLGAGAECVVPVRRRGRVRLRYGGAFASFTDTSSTADFLAGAWCRVRGAWVQCWVQVPSASCRCGVEAGCVSAGGERSHRLPTRLAPRTFLVVRGAGCEVRGSSAGCRCRVRRAGAAWMSGASSPLWGAPALGTGTQHQAPARRTGTQHPAPSTTHLLSCQCVMPSAEIGRAHV